MNTDYDVNILSGLIGATMDSARHYRKVADNIGNPRIRALFEHLSIQRKLIALELQEQRTAICGNPQSEGILTIHPLRLFGNLRHAMDYGYCALIDEVERCEERIKAKYEHALTDGRLSAPSRTVVQNAYASVQEGCADMHALKRYPHAEQVHGELLEQR
ncbi:PA2169 family four-helix-bundle protein [Dyella choica]|uniref:PA2169 family four-helix-bundle protein n=1 Tax=Dyella choica TaxID=1927959 RepID=A0A432M995_9GAMM|nr:PA2169 family four-helix-bundle protein [Dyella choica]RUL78173.1 PA2169 family four-helix-bundle protein [Dyella choica]